VRLQEDCLEYIKAIETAKPGGGNPKAVDLYAKVKTWCVLLLMYILIYIYIHTCKYHSIARIQAYAECTQKLLITVSRR
jgi:hypothetical protein